MFGDDIVKLVKDDLLIPDANHTVGISFHQTFNCTNTHMRCQNPVKIRWRSAALKMTEYRNFYVEVGGTFSDLLCQGMSISDFRAFGDND